jgi:release factor glutamine methyltransferase
MAGSPLTVSVTPEAVNLFDAQAVLASPAAKEAMVSLAKALRVAGYDCRLTHNPLTALALGRSVEPMTLIKVVGSTGLDALCRAGAADRDERGVALRFVVFAAGHVLAVVPRIPAPHAEIVYLDHDSIWLLRSVWRLAPGGDLAVDLGTGTGYLAAALLTRYRTIVATDLLPTTAAVAALTLAINDRQHGGSVVADVAVGLRPGSADLVTANPPWVPVPTGHGCSRAVFGDGGPSGTELPTRFIQEGAALLSPGGIGLFQCVDVTCSDGARPIARVCESLEDQGMFTEMRPVIANGPLGQLMDQLPTSPQIMAARLVTVIVRRS